MKAEDLERIVYARQPPPAPPAPRRKPSIARMMFTLVAVGVLVVGFAFVVNGLRDVMHRGYNAGPLQLAVYDDDLAGLKNALTRGVPADSIDSSGDTALHWAVYHAKPEFVKTLLEHGADPNGVNGTNLTPLMGTGTPLWGRQLQGGSSDRTEIARLLVRAGADVNRRLGDGSTAGTGQTALHFAAASRNAELVKLLLESGADPTIKESSGLSPLDVARFNAYSPNDDVIRLLSERLHR